jgi:hypothetical protein
VYKHQKDKPNSLVLPLTSEQKMIGSTPIMDPTVETDDEALGQEQAFSGLPCNANGPKD